MNLLTVIVSLDRLPLLRETVESYMDTVTEPHDLVVVDNGSGSKTRRWLIGQRHLTAILLPENRYPGYATNRGWRLLEDRHTVLHRADNDVRFLPGWCDRVAERFAEGAGQVGLRTDGEEDTAVPAVGGNMAISRAVYDAGIRYTDAPWGEVPWEDGDLSARIHKAGFVMMRVRERCLVHLGDPPDFSDPYTMETYRVRGLIP